MRYTHISHLFIHPLIMIHEYDDAHTHTPLYSLDRIGGGVDISPWGDSPSTISGLSAIDRHDTASCSGSISVWSRFYSCDLLKGEKAPISGNAPGGNRTHPEKSSISTFYSGMAYRRTIFEPHIRSDACTAACWCMEDGDPSGHRTRYTHVPDHSHRRSEFTAHALFPFSDISHDRDRTDGSRGKNTFSLRDTPLSGYTVFLKDPLRR